MWGKTFFSEMTFLILLEVDMSCALSNVDESRQLPGVKELLLQVWQRDDND